MAGAEFESESDQKGLEDHRRAGIDERYAKSKSFVGYIEASMFTFSTN